jgi:hypothetical protein
LKPVPLLFHQVQAGAHQVRLRPATLGRQVAQLIPNTRGKPKIKPHIIAHRRACTRRYRQSTDLARSRNALIVYGRCACSPATTIRSAPNAGLAALASHSIVAATENTGSTRSFQAMLESIFRNFARNRDSRSDSAAAEISGVCRHPPPVLLPFGFRGLVSESNLLAELGAAAMLLGSDT